VPRLVNVEIIGARDVKGRFQRATAEVQIAQREEMRELGRAVVKAVQAEAPVRTGRLKRGITMKTAQSGNQTRVTISSAAKYTDWVINGRRGFGPKKARALRFEPGPPGSGFIYRKWVGPSRPNPFVRRALGTLNGEPERTAGRIATRIERAFTHS
jgi:hypothetical protein